MIESTLKNLEDKIYKSRKSLNSDPAGIGSGNEIAGDQSTRVGYQNSLEVSDEDDSQGSEDEQADFFDACRLGSDQKKAPLKSVGGIPKNYLESFKPI